MAVDAKYGKITAEKGNLTASGHEPVFIIRAQDASSVAALWGYREAAEKAGAQRDLLAAVVDCVILFEKWQKENPDRVKVPD